jgi:uncharacterized protein YegP (UPF0339 family)
MAAVRFEMVLGVGARIQSKIYGHHGDVVLTSQGFQHKEACLEWIRTVKEYGTNEKLLVMKGEPGKLGFLLKAPNHKVVIEAGPYKTPEERDGAVAAVRGASQAVVVDKA